MTLYIPLQMSAIFKLSHFYAQVAVAAILSLISGNGLCIDQWFFSLTIAVIFAVVVSFIYTTSYVYNHSLNWLEHPVIK